MKTFYIDITDFLNACAITGIQRAVINIVKNLAMEQGEKYRVVLLKHNNGLSFYVCDLAVFLENCHCPGEPVRRCVTEEQILVTELAGDLLWLDIDGVWGQRMRRSVLYEQLWKRNVRIGVYVHDVIVITHPQLFVEGAWLQFPAYMGAVLDYADYIFTSTEFSRDEVKRMADYAGIKRDIQYVVMTPGCDFSPKEVDESFVDPAAKAIADSGRMLMMVSTIEPRKNHTVLLDAFDAGLSAMGYKLVFVGRAGWKAETIIQRIQGHPENGRSLFWLQGLNDDTLHYLYRKAIFVLFPSYIEGFGLATVEAMSHGTPLILSDVPVLRETGRELADYFPPDDPQALVDIIRGYERDPEAYVRKKELLAGYEPPTWGACVETIKNAVLSGQPAAEDKTPEQIVFAGGGTPETLLEALRAAGELMPFLRKAAVIGTEQTLEELKERYGGPLALDCLPEAKCLAAALVRPEIDGIFLLSGADTRPLAAVQPEDYRRSGRYRAYTCGELAEARYMTGTMSGERERIERTGRFLRSRGCPDLDYDAKMPQIVDKGMLADMLKEWPEAVEGKLCLISAYFNWAVARRPERISVETYRTVGWPPAPADRRMTVYPTRPLFVYGGINAADWLAAADRARNGACQWEGFQRRYAREFGRRPSLVLQCENDRPVRMLDGPRMLEFSPEVGYWLEFVLLTQERGRWKAAAPAGELFCAFGGEAAGETATADGAEGTVVCPVRTSGGTGDKTLTVYWRGPGQEPVSVQSIPVRVSG